MQRSNLSEEQRKMLAVLQRSDLSLAAAAAAVYACSAAIFLRSSARCWPCSALTCPFLPLLLLLLLLLLRAALRPV
jgi:hypothetical protein